MRGFMILFSENITRVIESRMRWVVHEERMRDRKGVYGDLAGRSEGKEPRGRQAYAGG
jgi:hypothetical protein